MSNADPHCTFCNLIQGAGEVSICYEDAESIAFMDIQPVNTGHVLVVPRRHVEKFDEVPAELSLHLFRVASRLVPAVKQVSEAEGINIIVSSGSAAGQDEPHYHIHVIPRTAGDGFEVPLPFAGSKLPDRTLLDAIAVRIMTELRDPMGALRKAQEHNRRAGDAARAVAVNSRPS